MKRFKYSGFDKHEIEKRVSASSLKEKIDPLSFYLGEGQEIKFSKNSEWRLAGICPFHNDKKEGSFRVNIENGAFKCFSCGEKGGDVITFFMKKYGLTFFEALQKLAVDWGWS